MLAAERGRNALYNTPLAWLTAEVKPKAFCHNPESDAAKLISDNAYNASNTDNSATPQNGSVPDSQLRADFFRETKDY